ncbi:unnamed protein product [Gadus morhua 'NCC']
MGPHMAASSTITLDSVQNTGRIWGFKPTEPWTRSCQERCAAPPRGVARGQAMRVEEPPRAANTANDFLHKPKGQYKPLRSVSVHYGPFGGASPRPNRVTS